MCNEERHTDPDHIARDAGIVDGNQEFAALSQAVADLTRAACKPSGGERMTHALGLLVKFYAHASSAFYLAGGTVVPTSPERKLDLTSVFVLCRAAYETFFRFHHIFVEPDTPEARECMYLGWKLASYRGRQKYPATLPSSQQLKADEQVIIDQIKQELVQNTHHQALSKSERKGLKQRGQTKSWGDIALSAGLVGIHADHLYRYLCGPAHSGWIDVGQFATKGRSAAAEDIRLALEAIMIAMAFILDAFVKVFPAHESILAREQVRIIDAWKEIGSRPRPTETTR